MSLLLLADSLSAAARSPLKQSTASIDHIVNRLQQTSHLAVGQNSHCSKNKADISPRTDKAVRSTCANNGMSACRAKLIHNLYTVCVCLHLQNTANYGPGYPLLPSACEAVLVLKPGRMFGEKHDCHGQ